MIDEHCIERLRFDDFWICDVTLRMFGKERKTTLELSGQRDKPLKKIQQEALLAFCRNESRLTVEAERALYDYYRAVRPELIEQLGEDEANLVAPELDGSSGLDALVELEDVFFPSYRGESRRVFGYMFGVSWDLDRGVVVMFENERVFETGPQDIIL